MCKILLTDFSPMFNFYTPPENEKTETFSDLLCKSTDWFLYDGNIGR